jgi:hypothetical protein
MFLGIALGRAGVTHAHNLCRTLICESDRFHFAKCPLRIATTVGIAFSASRPSFHGPPARARFLVSEHENGAALAPARWQLWQFFLQDRRDILLNVWSVSIAPSAREMRCRTNRKQQQSKPCDSLRRGLCERLDSYSSEPGSAIIFKNLHDVPTH